MDRKNVRAILLMAGTGERFHSVKPKQFQRLAGKKIYLHTLEALLHTECFCEILLVVAAEYQEEVKQDIKRYQGAILTVVLGGKSRQESSFLGILECDPHTDIILIHDAVRPFVSQRVIEENIEKALHVGAVDTCIPSSDTIVYAKDHEFVSDIPPRKYFLRGQTPQTFHYSLIVEAHKKGKENLLEEVSDDCRLVKEMGHEVAIVLGEEENMKITHACDLMMAEQILRSRFSLRESSCFNQPKNLRGAKIAVTGGTGGIGRAICTLLEEKGAIPIPLSRSSPRYSMNFLDTKTAAKSFQTLYQEEGLLDGLINCVGVLERGPLETLSELNIEEQIILNLHSVILSCKYVKLKEGGQIINMASSSYLQGRKELSVYGASKAAIVNFTQAFAEEREDLIVNVIAPQRTDTLMRREHFPEDDPASLLRAEEVAREVLLLLESGMRFSHVIEVRKQS